MKAAPMESTVAAILASGKGILAADESLPTIEKRFKALDISCTEENRRAYRDLLVTTPRLHEFISGVILFDETIRQKSSAGVAIPVFLKQQNIVPGIKVDWGANGTASPCAMQRPRGAREVFYFSELTLCQI